MNMAGSIEVSLYNDRVKRIFLFSSAVVVLILCMFRQMSSQIFISRLNIEFSQGNSRQAQYGDSVSALAGDVATYVKSRAFLVPAIESGVRAADRKAAPLDDVVNAVADDIAMRASFRNEGRVIESIEYRDKSEVEATGAAHVFRSQLTKYFSDRQIEFPGVIATVAIAPTQVARTYPSSAWMIAGGLIAGIILLAAVVGGFRMALVFAPAGAVLGCGISLLFPQHFRIAADIVASPSQDASLYLQPRNLRNDQAATIVQTPYGYLGGWQQVPNDETLLTSMRTNLRVEADPDFDNVYHVSYSDTSELRARSLMDGLARELNSTFEQVTPSATRSARTAAALGFSPSAMDSTIEWEDRPLKFAAGGFLFGLLMAYAVRKHNRSVSAASSSPQSPTFV